MAESAAATSSGVDAAAQRAAEQARLRKERREAKIKAGGSARLNKITGIGGRIVGDTEQASPVVSGEAFAPDTAPTHAADPDEVDISHHFYAPNATAWSDAAAPEGAISEAQLRQMMLGLDRPGQSNSPSPAPGPNGATMEDDPLMKLMAQMMGGGGGDGFPPGASLFPGMPNMPGMPPQQQQPTARPDGYTSFFRLLHALLALSLGLYVTLLTPFSGTKLEREHSTLAHAQVSAEDDANEHHKRIFFWIFATGEAVLLTSRFFLDKGRQPPSGMLWTVIGFIPEPFKGYVTVSLRYGQIFTTVRADILACMFVLGICSWWRS
ncbi:hypothetical protein TOPH_01088 [Tolypocladium ophioglossoides CBS 100239]|uniref:Sad1-interacting factor 1 n=1 Tax=Tolypocladium ophioglossoides (strain CBS 100239) TaxID=1163406 RepID=A0A0L0NLA4_TOLOC|nr:hypothetical protein TOPH_01088 [Tolypocladium ophioglossoides CBS 100239]